MKLAPVCAAVVACMIGTAATASTVTVGSYSFDKKDLADTAEVVRGYVVNPDRMTGGNLTKKYTFFGRGGVAKAGFDDNRVYNGAGVDLVIFEGWVERDLQISLTENGAAASKAHHEVATVSGSWSESMNVYGYDLTDLGVAEGDWIDEVFIHANGYVQSVFAVAGVHSSFSPAIASMPLPASTLLLLGALGFGAFVGRRRQSA